MKKYINFVFLIITLSVYIGCSGASKSTLEDANSPRDNVDDKASSLLKKLPTSRYLSAQSDENPRVPGAQKGGYDADYKMLAFRWLENIGVNKPDAEGKKTYVEGVREGARVIRAGQKGKEEYNSKELLELFSSFVNHQDAHFKSTLENIIKARKANIKALGTSPLVVISGLGPVGLLTALEAYYAGSSVIGVEKRAQYTRPQILRLSIDTLDRIAFFSGKNLWKYLISRGVVSRSPNWAANKFDVDNELIYPQIKAINEKIIKATTDAEKAQLQTQKRELQEQILAPLKDELKLLKNKGLEPETVEIIRINHLETFLAALLEEIAKNDPEHLRLYYGSTLKAKKSDSNFSLEVAIEGKNASTIPMWGDVIVLTEGAGSEIRNVLGIPVDTVSKPLYGSTVALRLPTGFDIGLRPIENLEGSASVKGIAEIDQDKLTKPGKSIIGGNNIDGTRRQYTWTMIGEQELCRQLNQVLEKTDKDKSYYSDETFLLPCETPAAKLSKDWQAINGGKDYYLPRTRYFFTGGIAYLGAGLTKSQQEMFFKDKDSLKKYLLVLAKKHMPREYIESQEFNNRGRAELIAPEALGTDIQKAKKPRVITVTEGAYSLSTFPIELKRAREFMKKIRLKNENEEPKEVVVILAGDAYATTHFFTGSGAVNGLRAAVSIGKALKNGARDQDWQKAGKEISDFTDEMHNKVMRGTGNAPLDGPYNAPL